MTAHIHDDPGLTAVLDGAPAANPLIIDAPTVREAPARLKAAGVPEKLRSLVLISLHSYDEGRQEWAVVTCDAYGLDVRGWRRTWGLSTQAQCDAEEARIQEARRRREAERVKEAATR